MTDAHSESDPCGRWTKTQWFAVVWFCAAIAFGGLLTKKLSEVDRWMYDNNGEKLDYTQYRSNRHGSTSLASEHVDPRNIGGYARAAKEVE